MSEHVIKILMKRDGIDRQDAEDMVGEAKQALIDCLNDGDFMSTEDVCSDYLGLEPDFLLDIMSN